MEWVKLDLRTLRSQEYLGSDPIARATWLNLLGFCADKENGGVIRDCKSWKDRMWQQLCGVTQAETRLDSLLFKWEGENLVVLFYPEESESLVRKRREAGRAGADSRWQKEVLPLATPPGANAQQTRTEQKKQEHRKAKQKAGESSACSEFDWEAVQDWLELVGSAIPDRPRAESLAREFLEEMHACQWIVAGNAVRNPLGLLVDRLKKDKAYLPKPYQRKK